jgi:hypothetical protein
MPLHGFIPIQSDQRIHPRLGPMRGPASERAGPFTYLRCPTCPTGRLRGHRRLQHPQVPQPVGKADDTIGTGSEATSGLF